MVRKKTEFFDKSSKTIDIIPNRSEALVTPLFLLHKLPPYGTAEATGLGCVCFVVIIPRVLSTELILGLLFKHFPIIFFIEISFVLLPPPPPHANILHRNFLLPFTPAGVDI